MTTVDSPELSGDDWKNRIRRLLNSAFGPFLALIVVLGLFAVADVLVSQQMLPYFSVDAEGKPKSKRPATFCKLSTAQQILRDSSKVGVAALGMTLIIIAGGIDLSVGSAMALCATVIAWYFKNDYSAGTAICMGISTGCLLGAINGVLISKLKVVPFIVTLGTMTIFVGVGLVLSKNTAIRAYGKVPTWLIDLQNPYPSDAQWWHLVSSGVWLWLLLAVVVALILKYSVFGRHVFALGSNEMTARLCGINVTQQRILVYAIAGIFVGIAGLYQFTILNGEGNPNGGNGVELEVIAAVVIGGGSLNGGRGSVLGTLSGAVIMSTIQNGCVTLGIPSSYQKVIIGIIIIAAVTLDQMRQRRLLAAGAG